MNDTREWTLRISPSGVIQVALVADLSDDLQYVRVIPKAEAERRVQEVETKVTREAATAVAAETKWLRQVQGLDCARDEMQRQRDEENKHWLQALDRVRELETEKNKYQYALATHQCDRAEKAEARVQELEGLVREMLSDDQDGYRLRPDLEKRALTALAMKPNRKED